MLSGAEPSTTFGHGGFVTLTLPRAGLQDLVPDLGSALVRPIHDGVEALRMLKGYLRVLTDGEPLTSKDLGQAFATHVLDLTALAVGACGDRGELAGRRGLRAARLEAVLRVIRTEYSDPHIAPDRVATRFGISTRYLHHLLQETGTSFAERVQTLRLEKAFSLLSGETGASRNVSDAAYGAGFSDLSLFNRLFRLRYGLTPTAARGRGR